MRNLDNQKPPLTPEQEKKLSDLECLKQFVGVDPVHQMRFVELFLDFVEKNPHMLQVSGRALLIPILEKTLSTLKAYDR